MKEGITRGEMKEGRGEKYQFMEEGGRRRMIEGSGREVEAREEE